jgi:hypothetical protein
MPPVATAAILEEKQHAKQQRGRSTGGHFNSAAHGSIVLD